LRKLRKILALCLISSMLVWALGFIIGSGVGITWALAELAAVLAPLSGILLIIMLATRLGAPIDEVRRRAGQTLKCIECGKPAVPNFSYCQYHLEIKRAEEDRDFQ